MEINILQCIRNLGCHTPLIDSSCTSFFFGRKVVNLTSAESSWSWLFGWRGWNVVNILASFMGIIWKQFMSWIFLKQWVWWEFCKGFGTLLNECLLVCSVDPTISNRIPNHQPTYPSLVNFYPWLKMMEFEAGKSFQKYSWLFVVSIWNFRGFFKPIKPVEQLVGQVVLLLNFPWILSILFESLFWVATFFFYYASNDRSSNRDHCSYSLEMPFFAFLRLPFKI